MRRHDFTVWRSIVRFEKAFLLRVGGDIDSQTKIYRYASLLPLPHACITLLKRLTLLILILLTPPYANTRRHIKATGKRLLRSFTPSEKKENREGKEKVTHGGMSGGFSSLSKSLGLIPPLPAATASPASAEACWVRTPGKSLVQYEFDHRVERLAARR